MHARENGSLRRLCLLWWWRMQWTLPSPLLVNGTLGWLDKADKRERRRKKSKDWDANVEVQSEGATINGGKEEEMRFLLFPAGPGCGHHGLETRCVQFCSESSFTVSDPSAKWLLCVLFSAYGPARVPFNGDLIALLCDVVISSLKYLHFRDFCADWSRLKDTHQIRWCCFHCRMIYWNGRKPSKWNMCLKAVNLTVRLVVFFLLFAVTTISFDMFYSLLRVSWGSDRGVTVSTSCPGWHLSTLSAVSPLSMTGRQSLHKRALRDRRKMQLFVCFCSPKSNKHLQINQLF